MLFFRFKKADHRYWKLINYALTWARTVLFLSIWMPVAPMLQHVCLFTSQIRPFYATHLTIICCCQVQNYIYWIISTENDHRHHHKFIKYEKRFRKEGNASAYISSKIFATSALVWTRSTSFSSFQRFNWSPTYILHLFHLEDTALLFPFLSESVKVRFLPRVDTFSSDMLFIVSKQCACSKRVHIEVHMNRGGLNWILVILDNNSDNDRFWSFLSKKEHKSYLLQLHFSTKS